jgi:hypothetical protein
LVQILDLGTVGQRVHQPPGAMTAALEIIAREFACKKYIQTLA